MNAPIKIEGLAHVVKFTESVNGRFEEGWRYYPTAPTKDEICAPEQLRIEIVTRTETGGHVRGEVRLVKGGPGHGAKHLHVIRIRNWNRWRIGDAAWRLRQEFFQKGW